MSDNISRRSFLKRSVAGIAAATAEEKQQRVNAFRDITCPIPQGTGQVHTIAIKALTHGVILDEVYLTSSMGQKGLRPSWHNKTE